MTTTTLYASADTFMNYGAQSTNYGTNTLLCIGEANTDVNLIRRSLLKFDLSSLLGERIVSAKIRLCVVEDYSSTIRDEYVYRLKQNWVESQATWLIYSTGNSWGSPGADGTTDIDSTEIAVTSVAASPSIGSWIEFELDTTEFQKMCDGTYTNYGFMMRTIEELNDRINYSSREGANDPQLVIEHVPNFIPKVIWI